VVTITALQPGADAAEMEQTVSKPIEEILQGLEDVKEIVSTSADSSVVMRAEFDWSGDPDEYFNNTVREVSAIRSRLPADLVKLDFKKILTTNASRLPMATTQQPYSALESIYVANRSGVPIALDEIASPQLVAAPALIKRRNLERAVEVSAQTQPGVLPSRVTADAQTALAKLPYQRDMKSVWAARRRKSTKPLLALVR
jgi:multidrug efflux pump subunit AcrB